MTYDSFTLNSFNVVTSMQLDKLEQAWGMDDKTFRVDSHHNTLYREFSFFNS